jgi:hypothetical protein
VKKILNTQGMSLVQVVIAAGIMSMLGVFLMRMQENQTKNQNNIAAKAEIISFMQKLNTMMGTPGYCEKNLKGISVEGDEPVVLDQFVAPTDRVIFKVGEAYGDRQIILKGIEQKEFFYDDVEKTRGILTFNISLEKKKRSFGAKIIKKTLDVIVSVDDTGVIQGCGSTGSSLVTASGDIDVGTVQKVIEKTAKEEEVEGVSEEQIKKIIEANPALKEMQEAIKNMNKSNEEFDKMNEELEK